MVTPFDSAAESVAVTVAGFPSSTGFGVTDSRTVGVVGVVTVEPAFSGIVSSSHGCPGIVGSVDNWGPITVTQIVSSSSRSPSSTTLSVAVARREPLGITISVVLFAVPGGSNVKSTPATAALSPLPSKKKAIVIPPVGAGFEIVAVNLTRCPSTGRSVLAVSVASSAPTSEMVTKTEVVVPGPTDAGRVPSATVNVSWSTSVSWFVEIVPVPLVCPAVMATPDSVP